MSKPIISIVLCGRNDNYGGEFVARFQRFIDWNTKFLETYKIETEIIFVNWNPIAENPSIEELVKLPDRRKYVSFRIITVPENIHKQYIEPEKRKTVPVFEFIAKNVGIRRAKGEYILTTNADILFSEEIIREISNNNLSSDSYYRAIRCDFHKTESDSLDKIHNAIFKIFLPGGVHELNSKGNFISTLKNLYQRDMRNLTFKRAFSKLAYYSGLDFLIKKYFRPEWLAHCNASGDFILLSKTNWLSLKGFPENTYISTHTDSIMTLNIYVSKFKEIIFPLPIYHQDHQRRFDFNEKNADIEKMYNELQRVGKLIFSNNKPVLLNAEDNWGLNGHYLEEIIC